jgi:hypothetical protein
MKLVIAITVFFASCFNPPGLFSDDKCPVSSQATPLCTVLANAAEYAGKEIVVRGLYRMVIHGSILMGSGCPKVNVNLRGAPNWNGEKHAIAVICSLTKKDQFQPVDIVFRGIFRVAHQGLCFGQNCLPHGIEEVELLCASSELPKSFHLINGMWEF